MPRNVVVGAYQAQWEGTKDKMIDKHAEIVKDAAKKGVQILCFQELFLGNIGVYICYDRHFPEGARILGLNGADIVFNPSATVEGLSAYLWKLEQPAHAVANGYFIAAINRVGEEEWKTGKFYGSSYICSPRGKFLAEAAANKDELIYTEIDLDEIREVRNTWQFYRDRRPETYSRLTDI